jgi:hypothetical protein
MGVDGAEFTDIKAVSGDVPAVSRSTPLSHQGFTNDHEEEEYVDYTDDAEERTQALTEARRVAAIGVFLLVLGMFLLIHSIVDIATVGTNGTNTSLIIIAVIVLTPGCWQAVRSWRFFCVERGQHVLDSEDAMSSI